MLAPVNLYGRRLPPHRNLLESNIYNPATTFAPTERAPRLNVHVGSAAFASNHCGHRGPYVEQ